jgi:hypothetical protein
LYYYYFVCDILAYSQTGQTIVASEPTFRKMTLQCGHAFSAMACLYYFCVKKLQCPLCRTGFEHPLDTRCIPEHLRAILVRQVAFSSKATCKTV